MITSSGVSCPGPPSRRILRPHIDTCHDLCSREYVSQVLCARGTEPCTQSQHMGRRLCGALCVEASSAAVSASLVYRQRLAVRCPQRTRDPSACLTHSSAVLCVQESAVPALGYSRAYHQAGHAALGTDVCGGYRAGPQHGHIRLRHKARQDHRLRCRAGGRRAAGPRMCVEPGVKSGCPGPSHADASARPKALPRDDQAIVAAAACLAGATSDASAGCTSNARQRVWGHWWVEHDTLRVAHTDTGDMNVAQRMASLPSYWSRVSVTASSHRFPSV